MGRGIDVEVINYVPVRASLAYLRLLSVGRERGFANVRRVHAFHRFINQRLKLSGAPMLKREQLTRLGKRYDLAFTGSDEVWKVNVSDPSIQASTWTSAIPTSPGFALTPQARLL